MSHEVATPVQVGLPIQSDIRLWLVAFVFFGVGDVATTALGLTIEGVVEISPTVGPHLVAYGIGAMVALKLALFAGAFLLWRYVPRPHCLGIPLGLALVGVGVTGWNLGVIVVAASL